MKTKINKNEEREIASLLTAYDKAPTDADLLWITKHLGTRLWKVKTVLKRLEKAGAL